jgi:hypothetical protein
MSKEKRKKDNKEKEELPACKSVLLVVNYYAGQHPFVNTHYYILDKKDGDKKTVFDTILGQLISAMSDAYRGGRENLIGAMDFWRVFMRFFLLCPDVEMRLPDTTVEQHEEGRREMARKLMVKLGMIKKIADFTNPEIGADFRREDIAFLYKPSAIDVMMHGKFDTVVTVHPMCSREIWDPNLLN